MVKEKEFFIKLINASLYNKKILDNIDLDWNDLKEEARQHNCMAIIFPAIKQIQTDYNCIPKDIYEEWEEKVVEMAAAQCIKNYELNYILDCLRQSGIEGIIFKGAVIADTYPEYLLRVSGDADILIKSKDEKLALDILAKEGYLISNRKTALSAFKHRISMKIGQRIATNEDWRKFAKAIKDDNGRYIPYAGIVLWYINRKLGKTCK